MKIFYFELLKIIRIYYLKLMRIFLNSKMFFKIFFITNFKFITNLNVCSDSFWIWIKTNIYY